MIVVLVGATFPVAVAGDEASRELTTEQAERLFARRVHPLLVAKCHACHGDGPRGLEAEYDLRARPTALRGGESGEPAIVPGMPNESRLYDAVRWRGGLEMPPKLNDRLTADEIESIRRWIASGAPWPDAERRAELSSDDGVDSPEGVMVSTSGGLNPEWTRRRYDPADLWSYRPVSRPSVPTAPADVSRSDDWSHPIDAFVNHMLRSVSLEAAPAADARSLLRRMTFDLTGLPPGGEELDDFESAYERDADAAIGGTIDRLLASPHYGERMAQHWLDVVRYADTGGLANDWERPHAWRYRDYVIRSFNEDKPFDRFAMEQIAGDELNPAGIDSRVAVGFLRMGPWEQTAMSVAAVTRQAWLDDVTNAVGETFLGHSLRCAKCHDHKFDPVPTRDYYRIQAVFAATEFAEPDVPLKETVAPGERRARMEAWKRQLAPETLTDLTRLEGDNAFSRITRKLDDYRRRALRRYEPKSFGVTNTTAQPVSILLGGSLERPGDQVRPGVLSAMAGAEGFPVPEAVEGRRLAFARWVAHPTNTLTARVIVNRVWQWHFGRGLVASPNNFGQTGGSPSHPELLDYLAGRLMDDGWSIKNLHRLIMSSDAYRRSSHHPRPERLSSVDPDGVLLARFRPRRLTAEEIRDSMLAVSGELNRTGGGPGTFPEINWEVALQPRHIMGGIAPAYRPSLTPELRNRRTIHAFRYRGLADPLLEVLDRPGSDLSCERRDETTVPTQAFALFNGRFAHARSLAIARRIAGRSASSKDRIESAFEWILGRAPRRGELSSAARHLADMTRRHEEHEPPRVEIPEVVVREMIAEETGVPFRWRERLSLDGYRPDPTAADCPPDARALADLCLVLLNSSEFLHVY